VYLFGFGQFCENMFGKLVFKIQSEFIFGKFFSKLVLTKFVVSENLENV